MKDTVAVQVALQGLFVKSAVTPEGRAEATENVTRLGGPLVIVALIEEEPLVLP